MYAGLDMGSRTIGLVVLSGDDRIVASKLEDTGFEPIKTATSLLTGDYNDIVTTGYGRHAAAADFCGQVITEIKAHALGAAFLFDGVRTVLDIGGQDTKVILMDENASVIDFQMNDKCSAGTGKFLEVMSEAMGHTHISEFGKEALRGRGGVKISSMCTVFAESEAVSLVHRGVKREDIGLALHSSAVDKAAGMLKRIGFKTPLVFTGGVANNPCIVKLLSERLGVEIFVPREPQLVGALGAALSGNP